MLPEINISLSPQMIVACAAAVAALAAVALPFLLWRTDFSAVARRHLRRWAPLHLTLGPPAVVYLAFCGLASLSYHFWYVIPAVERGALTGLAGPASPLAATREQILSSWEFQGFYLIEWTCSFAGAFAFAGLVHWLGLSRVWRAIVIASLSVFAMYRTAACHVESTETSYNFTSGPEFRSQPDPIDAVPVLLGVALYAIAAHVRRPRRVVLTAGLVLAIAPCASGAELRPSWECLPAETAVVVRVPNGRAFTDALAERTKYGSVLLSPDRWQRIRTRLWELALSGGDRAEQTERIERFLAKGTSYGFDMADAAHAFDGEAGAALVVLGPELGGIPLVIGWMEPGQPAAERMLAAFGRGAEDWIDDPPAGFPVQLERRDIDLAGSAVTWLHARTTDPKALAEAHLFATRIGGRLLAALALVPKRRLDFDTFRIVLQCSGESCTPAMKCADEELSAVEQEAATRGLEKTREVFSRFLASHDAYAPAALAGWLDTPGLNAARPEGIPLVDVLARPPASPGNGTDDSMKRVGLDTLGAMAWWQSLDGGVWRSHGFVSLPAPRHGCARILDEPADAAAVPAFVTAEPTSFRQMSLDLGQAYSLLRDAIYGGEEPPPGSAIATCETQSEAVLGASVPAVLHALGSRHGMLVFPWNPGPAVKTMLELQRNRKPVAEDSTAPELPDGAPIAFVWELHDESPFQKALSLVGPLGVGGLTEEQGFRIVRFPGGISVALGRKHLVIAQGKDVAERMLAAIRDPPPPGSAFTTSAAGLRAAELLSAETAIVYGVGDQRHAGGWIGMAGAIVAALEPEDLASAMPQHNSLFGDFRRAALALWQAVLPSPAEWEGAIGADTTLWQANEHGILLRSATDLPAL